MHGDLPSRNIESGRFVIVSPEDDVAIAICEIENGSVFEIQGQQVITKCTIPKGHKFAINLIKKHKKIIKYGFPIGRALKDIEIGDWVHTHNLESDLENQNQEFQFSQVSSGHKKLDSKKFTGFRRENGDIGIRNEIWIFPTVGCVSALANKLANSIKLGENSNIDGIYSFGHQFGCSQLGDDLENTKSIIANLARHPNNCGVLIIGLGCENNRLDKLLTQIPKVFHHKIKSFEAQKVPDEFAKGMEILEQIIEENKNQTRQEIDASELVIGIKCGGSDGFSGLSANPIIGRVSDYFTNIGGKVIMTEIPEIFGAEPILYERCENKEVFDNLVATIEDFKEYFKRNGQKIYENPSPGNKDGGISTLEEKSLGAVQKGGKAIVTDILKYGQSVQKTGLSVMNAPGNDAISSTALAASGAHIILFSTGRGTPLGFAVPTLKIASNTALWENKPHWIDFNAGQAMESGDYEKIANHLIDLILDIANGARTRNEINGIRDFAIWKNGITL